jgi:hypothetical protein
MTSTRSRCPDAQVTGPARLLFRGSATPVRYSHRLATNVTLSCSPSRVAFRCRVFHQLGVLTSPALERRIPSPLQTWPDASAHRTVSSVLMFLVARHFWWPQHGSDFV